MFYTIITIPAIAAIVYTIIDIVKTACGGDEKFRRFISISAARDRYCTGLSATGTNQSVKQFSKKEKQPMGYTKLLLCWEVPL